VSGPGAAKRPAAAEPRPTAPGQSRLASPAEAGELAFALSTRLPAAPAATTAGGAATPPAGPPGPALRAPGLLVQRAPAADGAPPAVGSVAVRGLLVGDAAQPGPGQMRRGEFLAELRAAVCATVEEALAGSAWSVTGCPFLERWFAYYEGRETAQVERAIHRYVPESRDAASARDYISLVTARLGPAVRRWRETGEVTGLPEGVRAELPPPDEPGSSTEPGVARMALPGDPASPASDPAAVRASLGAGVPMDAATRGRMEGALGTGLGDVRVHTDAHAASLARGLRARAFAVGEHVAFGAEEYRPGTLYGDALLAHELAHTRQQVGATRSAAAGEDPALERDAGAAARGVVEALWAGAEGQTVRLRQTAGLRLQRCSIAEHGYDPEFREEYHRSPPTPEEMIARHTTALGDLDEEALGKTLALMAWYTPRHHDYIRRVFEALDWGDRDDVAAAMVANTQDSDLVDIARTEEGRALLRYIVPELTEGWTWPGGDVYAAVRALRALRAHEAAQEAIEGELQDMRNAVGAVGPPAEEPVDLLSARELQERLRLVEVRLQSFERRWSGETDIMAAITAVRARVTTARANVASQAPALSRSVQLAQQLLETCELVLTGIDEQISSLERELRRRGTEEANIRLLRYVRERFVEALGSAMGPEAALRFAQAGAALQQLSLSQAELELAVLQSRPGLFNSVGPKLRAMRTFASHVIGELNALETEARSIRTAEQEGTDVQARRAAANRKFEGLSLSHRILANWELVIQVAEALESGFSFTDVFYGHDVDVNSLHARLDAMAQLAIAGDYDALRRELTAYESDEEIREFYEDVPSILKSSGIVVAIGVMLAAAAVTWGVGAVFAAPAGAGAGAAATGTAATVTAGTAARTLATAAGTTFLNALVFTSVHRGLAEATGVGAHGSFFEDLLWNFGLFGVMRVAGGAVLARLQARGLAHLARPVQVATTFGILEGYGVARFAIEEGRLPTAGEFVSMTAQTVVILASLMAMHATVARFSALGRFQARWGSQFEVIRHEQQALERGAQRALAEGRASQFEPELRHRGQALEARLRNLIDQVRAEANIEALRTQLDGMLTLEASQAALTQSLGMLPEVALRRAGGQSEFSYRHGETARLSDGLRSLGAREILTLDVEGRPRVVEARFADRPSLVFVERAPEARPSTGTAEAPVSPAEQNARRLEAAKEALERRRISWSRVPEELRSLEGARPRAQTSQRTIQDTAARLARLEGWIAEQPETPWRTGREVKIEVAADAAQAHVARLPRGAVRDHLTANPDAAIVFGALSESAPRTAAGRMQAIWDAWTQTAQQGSFAEFAESRLVEAGAAELRTAGHGALAALLESDARVQSAFGRMGYDTGRLRVVQLYHEHGYEPGAARRLSFAEYLQHEVGSLQGEGRSWAERRARLAVPIPPGGFEPLRTRLTSLTDAGTLTEIDARILWRWNAMIEALITDSAAQVPGAGAATSRATAVLNYLIEGVGRNFSESTYRTFRHRIRALVVDDILFLRGGADTSASPATHQGTPVRAWGEQLTRLETWESRVPAGDSATIGALWTAYAQARFEMGLPGGTNVARVNIIPGRGLRLPDGRMGDAAARFGARVDPPDPAPGEWAIDFKGGNDPFDIDQARNYSTHLQSGSGNFQMGGRSYRGLAFVFRNATAAGRAATALEGMHSNLKVGVFDASGQITWLR
jgi:hypothetical protein